MPRLRIIVHFQPLELYPPVMNLLNYISKQENSPRVVVFSTWPAKDLQLFAPSGNISVKRFGRIRQASGSATRYFNYLLFYTMTMIGLLRSRPSAILYFETLSAYPVYLFKRYFARKCRIFIHYHEYMSPPEYRDGMKLVRFFHEREKWLYRNSEWVSHTNEARMKLFLHDEALERSPAIQILPNYPPRQWLRDGVNTPAIPVKIVYVGALSLSTMFTREFCSWIQQMQGRATLDIYSQNVAGEAADFITGLRSPWIKLHKGINYYSLPEILKQYHVGVILYNGNIPNYVYNAPNKLFEYLACGLDVWFPSVMEGTMDYATKGAYPKVIPLDFTMLNTFSPEEAISRTGCTYSPGVLSCENVLPSLTDNLFSDSPNIEHAHEN